MSKDSILVWRGPLHHTQLLSPVENELEKRGMKVVRMSSNAEAAFETGLNSEKDYLWTPDFAPRAEVLTMYRDACNKLAPFYLDQTPLSLYVPVLTDRVVWEACTDYIGIRNIIEETQPIACLALHEINRWGMLLGYLSSVNEIPFFTLQEGSYYGEPWLYTNHNRYSTSFIWGETTKERLLASGSPPDRLVVAGHPDIEDRWEAAKQGEFTLQTSEGGEWLKDKKLMVVFVTNVSLGDSMNVSQWLAGLAESQWKCVVKTHFMAARPQLLKLQEMFAPHADSVRVIIDYEAQWPLLSMCDVFCVVGCSTATIEALWVGKPVTEIVVPGQHRSFSREDKVCLDGSAMGFVDAANAAVALWKDGAHRVHLDKFLADTIHRGSAARYIAHSILNKARKS